MDIPGVVGYEIVSMGADGDSPTGSIPVLVSADINMANVELEDYSSPVMFVVTSLLAGNEICHVSQTSESSPSTIFNTKRSC